MRFFWSNLSANAVALASVGTAAYLIANDKDHWGWFIFIAIITAGSYADRKEDKDDD